MTPPAPTLDVLLPRNPAGRSELPPQDDEAALLALYAAAPAPEASDARARWVRGVMVSTLDGAATGADGRSGSIHDAADGRVFGALRALADVVLVGLGTAAAEGYPPLVVDAPLRAGRRAAGRPDALVTAVVTGSGDLPPRLLGDEGPGSDDNAPAGPPPLVVTHARCPRLAPLRERLGTDAVLVTGEDRVGLDRALDALAERGLTRVQAEGGPHLLGRLVAAGLVDELDLTVSPLLVGGPAPRSLALDDWLDPAVDARLVHLLHARGVLLGRWHLA
ncbi:dihydrofolate reductase family protein [Cellulomonas endophytica]|uniref:dihydrofolate reductase family protein n=1 Tax=Cellulomonas endophytica TaxID=2494735 RepID=UPI001011EC32|nr:dihydrofolate reductase family protein [Cellulomonas endophytica]